MTQLNGKNLNGNHGNGSQKNSQVLKSPKKEKKNAVVNFNNEDFDQNVVLRQSPVWSRTIMISLVLLACFGIGWACWAKIEQVVPATGQLKPEGTVKDVQAPISGVVKTVYVKDGQQVKKGDLLLTFDPIATLAELSALNKIRTALIKENNIYRRLMAASTGIESEVEFLRSRLPADLTFLLKSRSSLVSENELLRSELKNLTTDTGIRTDEQQRLVVSKRELDSRTAAAKLEVEKTRKQLSQTQVKRKDTQNSLEIQEGILDKLKILAEEGGISQLQYLNQKQQVQTLKAEIAQLNEEEKRLGFEIQKGQQQTTNTVAASDKNILERIADNKKRIAEIDTQFQKVILENEQRLADISSKISQAQLNFKYQELRAPVSGTIFDLQAKSTGFVANPTEKLMQIVPNEKFVAEVFITNKDIGFVQPDMNVDVRIDSFPFSEFGDIKGKVTKIGKDALPPDQIHQFYRFPATIKLDGQMIKAQGREIPLQSGMSITANIKVREERTVMSLFTDLFTKQLDSLKETR